MRSSSFSLVEVIIALLILTILMSGAYNLFANIGRRINKIHFSEYTQLYAEQIIEHYHETKGLQNIDYSFTNNLPHFNYPIEIVLENDLSFININFSTSIQGNKIKKNYSFKYFTKANSQINEE